MTIQFGHIAMLKINGRRSLRVFKATHPQDIGIRRFMMQDFQGYLFLEEMEGVDIWPIPGSKIKKRIFGLSIFQNKPPRQE